MLCDSVTDRHVLAVAMAVSADRVFLFSLDLRVRIPITAAVCNLRTRVPSSKPPLNMDREVQQLVEMVCPMLFLQELIGLTAI